MSGQANVTKQKFSFLCGNFVKRNFIYAIKNAGKPWHYFEAQDSLSSAHGPLPSLLDSLISKMIMNKIKTVEVPLNEHQWMNYYDNEQFIFKARELKTCAYFYMDFYFRISMSSFTCYYLELMYIPDMQLTNEQSKKETSNAKLSYKYTDGLVFISGQTNPLLFLNEYEKCRDLKDDKDKMFKIRNFVDAPHRGEIH